ncbi:MAG: aspartyl-phosphate phosphatase Spo0E family protein [Halanaerobiaceae bacterium]
MPEKSRELTQINLLRKKLHKRAKNHSLHSRELIRLSQKLDEKIINLMR